MLVKSKCYYSFDLMVCCLNPSCKSPINSDDRVVCQSCERPLVRLLRNRFKVIERLGRGSFGITYLAIDHDKLDEECVVKQLVYEAQSTNEKEIVIGLFKREAKQLQMLGENPQIPSLIAYFEERGYLYLVQQYVQGQNLLKELNEKGKFNEKQIRSLLLDLLSTFKAIHKCDVIHRDIKPENIMRRSNDNKLVLIDFGVSKQLSKSIVSIPGTKVGSHGYASPEQMQFGIGQPNSDIYSLGASCFHLLTGVKPYDLLKKQGYSWVNNWKKYMPNKISSDIEAVIDKMLKTDPNDRYQNAESIIQILQTEPTKNDIQIPQTELTKNDIQILQTKPTKNDIQILQTEPTKNDIQILQTEPANNRFRPTTFFLIFGIFALGGIFVFIMMGNFSIVLTTKNSPNQTSTPSLSESTSPDITQIPSSTPKPSPQQKSTPTPSRDFPPTSETSEIPPFSPNPIPEYPQPSQPNFEIPSITPAPPSKLNQNEVQAVIIDPDGYTNVRQGKGTDTAIIDKIYENEVFYTTPQSSEWWPVRKSDNVSGYMHRSRIKIID